MTKIFCSPTKKGKLFENRKQVVCYPNDEMNPEDKRILESFGFSDEFDWGKSGPGTNALAVTLLFETYNNGKVAMKFYTLFAAEIISKMPEEWVLTEEAIEKWFNRSVRKKETIKGLGKHPGFRARDSFLSPIVAEAAFGASYSKEQLVEVKAILSELNGTDSQKTAQAVQRLKARVV